MDIGVQRSLTAAFIQQLPASLVFTPRSRVRGPSGGYVWSEGAPRRPQTVTFIEASTQGGYPNPVFTLDGVERKVEMVIVACWDATIARYDTFFHQGRRFEVLDIFYDNGYEKRALVSGRG